MRSAQNLRHTIRSWNRSPGLIAAVMITLALGIGASSAIFSVINRVLLRPLPYHRTVPLAFDMASTQTFDIMVSPTLRGETRDAVIGVATPGYFRAMGIALLHGRMFEDGDKQNTRHVALVNEAFARRYFPNEDPIGRVVDVAHSRQPDFILAGKAEIVGVVADVRQSDILSDVKPEIWNAYGQRRWLTMTLAIRTAGDPNQVINAVRSELRYMDRNLPLTNIRTAEDYHAAALARRKLSMMLSTALAGVALLLSTIGAYGVIAYSVRRRTHEIGVRIALGAERRHVRWLVVRQGLTMAGLGLAIGIPAALVATRLLESVLYGVTPHDPITFAALILIFVGVAFGASYMPARKATNVSPTVSLRFE